MCLLRLEETQAFFSFSMSRNSANVGFPSILAVLSAALIVDGDGNLCC